MKEHDLFPFQHAGTHFLQKNDRCFLLDEQGLGKTVQAVCGTSGFTQVLVICPASLKIQWKREFLKWNPTCSARVESYNYIQNSERAFQLSKLPWDCVIADECQNLANWTARQTRNFVELVKYQKKVWLLSGTPATRSASNWHSLLSIVEPGVWGKYASFCEKFCEKKEFFVKTRFGSKKMSKWDGWKNTEVLRDAVKKVALRRLKKDVANQLPSKFYSNLYVDIDAREIDLNVDEGLLEKCIEDNLPIPEHVSKVRQAIGIAKIGHCLEWLETNDKPILIFAWHKAVIAKLTRELKDKGIKCDCITGETSVFERQRIVDQFNLNHLDTLVLSIGAAGVGLNLPRAEVCFFLEIPWSYAQMVQAEDRSVRLNSKQEKVQIYRALAVNTLDEKVLEILEEKRVGMEAVVNA